MYMTRLILAAALAIGLTACAPIISTLDEDGIQEDPGKRTLGARIDDSSIETKAKVNLNTADDRLEQSHIRVHSFNGTVLLVGQVPSQEVKNLATRIAGNASKEVKQVHNELEISGDSTFFSRSNDAWIGTKLKTMMLANREISGLRTKVVTERGVVYLMGLVTHAEADRIVDLVSNSGGVVKVVRAFEYVD